MLTRILAWLGYRRSTPTTTLLCVCGAVALTYDETRGYCGPCYLKTIQ